MPRKTLPKSSILRTQKEFSEVFSASHALKGDPNSVVRCDPFIVYWKAGGPAQLGISVARRVIKESPKRNRIKRVLREWFRHERHELSGKYIIRIMKRPKDFTTETILSSLQKKIKALKA